MIPTVKRKNKEPDNAAQFPGDGIAVVAADTSASEAVGGKPLAHVALTIVAMLIACIVQWPRPHIVAWPVLPSQFSLSVLAQP